MTRPPSEPVAPAETGPVRSREEESDAPTKDTSVQRLAEPVAPAETGPVRSREEASDAPKEDAPAPLGPRDRIRVDAVELGDGADGWFTGRPDTGRVPEPAVGVAGNLSHRRPHEPARLAADREAAATLMGLEPDDLHLMQQVHGTDVAAVDASTPRGAEIREVDALVTAEPGRALVVLVADCVPVLLASDRGPVAAVHAGRRGVELGVIPATLAALEDLGAQPSSLTAAIGPAIGGCCYEVPADMRDAIGASHPVAVGETTWGTPSLDLPRAVERTLADAGVERIARAGACTRCDPARRWFSHRADPATGRQAGVVVRRSGTA